MDVTVQYRIFFSAQDRPWVREEDLELFEESLSFVTRKAFLTHLALTRLRLVPTDTIFSAYASRTKFEAYQFKPVLKLLSGDSHRMILADEVGLGKTIEAAIIYLELRARLNISRTLVVCPAGLRHKWRDEFYSRLDEDFAIWASDDIREFSESLERYGAHQSLQAICSIESLRQERYVQLLEQAGATFDLVIVDEAHHMRNPETLNFDLGQYLSRNSDALLLLTATPIQLRLEDLFYLLQLIDEGEYRDFALFQEQMEPNRFLHGAQRALSAIPPQRESALEQLRSVEATVLGERFAGNPYYQECISDLETSSALTPEEVVTLRRKIQNLNMLSHVLARTRKRDVAGGARREAQTVEVKLAREEMNFYLAVREHVRLTLSTSSGAPSFAISQRERQAASSLPAMRDQLREAIQENRIVLSTDTSGTELGEDEATTEVSFSEQAAGKRLLESMLALASLDSKFDAFYSAIRHILFQEPETKILVFSFFKRTLSYLRKRLRDHGIQTEVINGDIDISRRHEIVERFRDDPDVGVLLTSEVGSEGHDFQFCSVIVNYDLPWNPMRVEQRIGRLDRYGQRSPKVRVINLVLKDTIEERILYRLYQRLRVFEESIGDLEAILGPLMREVELNLLRRLLTPEQELEEAEALIRRLFEQQEDARVLENHRMELMGQDIIFQQQVEEAMEAGRFLSATELEALVDNFIAEAAPRSVLEQNRDGSYFLSDRGDLLPLIRASMNRRESEKVRDFLSRLGRGVPITFNAELAQQRKLLHFVTARHPLVRAARDHYDARGPVAPEQRLAFLRAIEPRVQGYHYFFIFSLRLSGANPSTTLVPVVVSATDGGIDQELSDGLLATLLRADDLGEDGHDRGEYTIAFEYALEHMKKRRDTELEEAQKRNEALLAAKVAALERTYSTKITKVMAQHLMARDERIRRMRESQLQNIRADHAERMANLDRSRRVSGDYELVAAGQILYQANERKAAMERFFSLIEKNWEKNKNVPSHELESAVDEAVRAVRSERASAPE